MVIPQSPLWVALSAPGQPVVDLEAYMTSLEKKQQSIAKMIESFAHQVSK